MEPCLGNSALSAQKRNPHQLTHKRVIVSIKYKKKRVVEKKMYIIDKIKENKDFYSSSFPFQDSGSGIPYDTFSQFCKRWKSIG